MTRLVRCGFCDGIATRTLEDGKAHVPSPAMLEAHARLADRRTAFLRPLIAACAGHAIALGDLVPRCTDLRIAAHDDKSTQVNDVQAGLSLLHFAIEICQRRLSLAQLPQFVAAPRHWPTGARCFAPDSRRIPAWTRPTT